MVIPPYRSAHAFSELCMLWFRNRGWATRNSAFRVSLFLALSAALDDAGLPRSGHNVAEDSTGPFKMAHAPRLRGVQRQLGNRLFTFGGTNSSAGPLDLVAAFKPAPSR